MEAFGQAKLICNELVSKGFQAYIVGGACRDIILNRKPKDYDIVTDAIPDQVLNIFPHSLTMGKSYGIVNVLIDSEPFDVATFRLDSDTYTDARRPDSVTYTKSYKDDAIRRDLTMNAIYFDPIEGVFKDPVDGIQDIEHKIIRFIGNPMDRLNEDRLRSLRAIRFSAQLGFSIEEKSWEALCDMGHSEDPLRLLDAEKAVSWDRIGQEMNKLITSKFAAKGIYLLKECGLLHHIIPEYDNMWCAHQSKRWHEEGSAGIHSMYVLSKCFTDDPIDRWSCLLHDIGKPQTLTIKPINPFGVREVLNVDTMELGEEVTYDETLGHKDSTKFFVSSCESTKITNAQHDIIGRPIAERILTRLRMPLSIIEPVCDAVRFHMDAHHLVDVKRAHKIRRFIGQKNFKYIMNLALADELGSISKEPYESLTVFVDEQKKKHPVMLPPPVVNGALLIQLGYKPGPMFKYILDNSYNDQLNGMEYTKVVNRIANHVKNFKE